MYLCKIDDVVYDVLVTGIRETTEILEGANSGIALYRNREIRDINGIKIGHAISFAPDSDPEAFENLYEHLFGTTEIGTIRESVKLEVIHGQNTIKYEAAYNTCDRGVVFHDEQKEFTGWDELTVGFRPIENQIDAEG